MKGDYISFKIYKHRVTYGVSELESIRKLLEHKTGVNEIAKITAIGRSKVSMLKVWLEKNDMITYAQIPLFLEPKKTIQQYSKHGISTCDYCGAFINSGDVHCEDIVGK